MLLHSPASHPPATVTDPFDRPSPNRSKSDVMRPPGPRRRKGLPHGPDEVRRSVLDAAAALFGTHGVAQVTLRDVAAEAKVNLGLISRYVGSRDELIRAVFSDLTTRLLDDISENPTASRGFEEDSVMVRWTLVLAYLVITDPSDAISIGAAVTDQLRAAIEDVYDVTPQAARLRAAQIMASAIGWRLYEPFLVASAGLEDQPLDQVRTELTRSNRRLAATPLPSPPDPNVRRKQDPDRP